MTVVVTLPWRDPVEVLSAFADEPWAIGFLSGDAGWSYLAKDPDRTLVVNPEDSADPFVALAELLGPTSAGDGPAFSGGVAGLAAYELGDRVERLGLARLLGWPDLACARYPAVLAFDPSKRQVLALGRTKADAHRAKSWLALTPRPTADATAVLSADNSLAYETAVADVIGRIEAGEIFQANIARRWRGRLAPHAHPFDLLASLAAASPAPFASYLRLPDRAVVSNSPERFLRVTPSNDGLDAETRPIKGTARRGRNPYEDKDLSTALQASAKDRAENLMIVDLMRNDLARVCAPGQVKTPELFRIESFANVHHLVSTVTGRLAAGRTAVDLLAAAFPPGSITGAPKVQAMKVIAGLEAPRGPFFGSMFHLGFDGGMDSSVLIRTAAFVQGEGCWSMEARAGAGIVADSVPTAERRETEAKISALRDALAGQALPLGK